MLYFLQNCIHPDAVLMLAVFVLFLFGYAYPGFRSGGSLIWLLWLFVSVLAAISWILLVFS